MPRTKGSSNLDGTAQGASEDSAGQEAPAAPIAARRAAPKPKPAPALAEPVSLDARARFAVRLAALRLAASHLGARLAEGGRAFAPRLALGLRDRRALAVGGAAIAIVVLIGAGVTVAAFTADGSGRTPLASSAPSPIPTTTSAPTIPQILSAMTAAPPPTEYPADVASTTSGIWFPFYDADKATRRPIAVMQDDHWAARPQAGLSQADIVYQALAEGGIPRYMAIYQTADPSLIGPIRSARLYYVAWAEEWQAMYVHVWGAPNAMSRLYEDHKIHIYNADGLRYLSTRYMWRVDWRVKPHNAYTDGAHLRALLFQLGGGGDGPKAFWAFADGAPLELRPQGGTIEVPYYYNGIRYQYDRATNTYLRWETTDVIRHRLSPEIDPATNRQVAPSNVVVMFMDTYMLAGHANLKKGRLDLDYLGSGKALVFQNGTIVAAKWVKTKEYAPTHFVYAGGPNAGKLIPLVRGQTFIQVVPPDTLINYTLGRTLPPQY